MIGCLITFGGIWASGELAAFAGTGRWRLIPVGAVLVATARLPGHLGNPRSAWPEAVRESLPGNAGLTACLLAVAAAFLLLLMGGWKLRRRFRRSVQTSRPGPGRPPQRRDPGSRWSAVEGRWAVTSDLRQLRVRRAPARRSGRLALGLSGRQLLATEARHSVLVIGPSQSGKTTGLAIPAILDWDGPVVATSVKDDLAASTLQWRRRQGPAWVFDPTSSSGLAAPARWSPLSGCAEWSDAQRMASWMVEATPGRQAMADAAFWYATAAKQLAPLMLAAERGALTMAAVVQWTNRGEFDEALRILEISGEADAATALEACAGREDRIRSSVATTLETVLAPFEDPVVAAATSGSDLPLDALFDERATLYLCGPAHEQQRVQALFAALVSTLVDRAMRVVAETGRRLDPPLLVVLDEAANIAPLRDLDTLASTAAGLGIQLLTVCQDLAQLASRYGPERSRTIANNHRAKLLLSGVSDLGTLDLISGLAGDRAVREETTTRDLRNGGRTSSTSTVLRRLAPSDMLRRIPPGHGVLVYGHLPPAQVRLRPWFEDRRLRALGRIV